MLYHVASVDKTFVVPKGVNVVYFYESAKWIGDIEDVTEFIDLDLTFPDYNIDIKCSSSGSYEEYGCYEEGYIGVTPGKTYRVQWFTNARMPRFYIAYSQSINTQTPNNYLY